MLSWFRKGKKNAGGGYRKDRPPEDDCCPICHDDFHVPCRTNCGHWFCGGCLLQLSRSPVNFQLFKCPMCGSLVYKLVPLSPALIQSRREEASEILREIKRYNSQKTQNEFIPPKDEDLLQGKMWLIVLLMYIVYTIYDFRLWTNEGIAFRLCQLLRCALPILAIWMRRRRMRG